MSQARRKVVSDHELEGRIRQTLARHAEAVDATPPAWSQLVERSGAVVIPLRSGDVVQPPAHAAGSRGGRVSRQWLRPALAAAAVLVVVLAAAVVVEGRGGGSGPSDGGPDSREPTEAVIPAPGAPEFDATTATPLTTAGPIDLLPDFNPTALATVYLSSVGLDDRQLSALDLRLWTDEPTMQIYDLAEGGSVTTAQVWWSVRKPDDSLVTDGAVFLRETSQDTWSVVGAFTAKGFIALDGVRRADGGVWLTISDYLPDPHVRVRLDGADVFEGILPAGNPTRPFPLQDPAPDRVVTIEVQHLVDGQPVSITAMALAPVAATSDPSAAPVPSTLAPSADFTAALSRIEQDLSRP